MPICRRMNLELYLSYCMKTNFKCTKDINIKHETLKVTEENKQYIIWFGVGKNFLKKTLYAQQLKPPSISGSS